MTIVSGGKTEIGGKEVTETVRSKTNEWTERLDNRRRRRRRRSRRSVVQGRSQGPHHRSVFILFTYYVATPTVHRAHLSPFIVTITLLFFRKQMNDLYSNHQHTN